MKTALETSRVARKIFVIRGHNVMLDQDLAELYGVPTKALNQAIKRNLDRFPEDFMFQLNAEESASLRSQFVTSKPGRGGRRYSPLAFTEQGVAMLSSVLRSRRAVLVNIAIMRTFVKLREMLTHHRELGKKLDELERRLQGHDTQIITLFEVIRQLTSSPEPTRRRIGFHAMNRLGSTLLRVGRFGLEGIVSEGKIA